MTEQFDRRAAVGFLRDVLAREALLVNLGPAEMARIAAIAREAESTVGKNRFFRMYPETGRFSRHAYRVHCNFFAAGGRYLERLAMAGNRTGKTHGAAYEFTCHLTGLYPDWWQGRRFDRPVDAWAVGESNEVLRDVIMEKLFGGAGKDQQARNELLGTGMIPESHIDKSSQKWRSGVPGVLDTIRVRWKDTNRYSNLGLKSYEQGAKKFMGTARQVIWLDEEPPLPVYTECCARTFECNGIVMMTFTPMAGISEVVKLFLPESMRAVESGLGRQEEAAKAERYLIQFAWDDVPHFTPEMIEKRWNNLPRHERRARRYGEPMAGAGRVYEIDIDDITVAPFQLPPAWPRFGAIDPGWNRTAALFGAVDRMSDCLYYYSEYYESEKIPALNALALSKRGAWIPHVMDPAGDRRQQDGKKAIEQYRKPGSR